MSISRMDKLLGGLDLANMVGVEIGALANPFVRREDGEIIYVDYADRDTLVAKYSKDPNVITENIVHVDAIWGANTLDDAVKGRKVDYVVASHVVEHVPDLITWLREIRSILNERGSLRLIVPDRRFTFDFLRTETQFSEIITSYLIRARMPQPQQIIDFKLGFSYVDMGAAWRGEISEATQKRHHTLNDALVVAKDVIENANYHDVHCWVFTPRSFAQLLSRMAEVGLLDFACEKFYDTEEGTFDFFVTLRPSNDQAYIAESWKRMQQDAKVNVPGSHEAQLQQSHGTGLGKDAVIETLARDLDILSKQFQQLKSDFDGRLSNLSDENAKLREEARLEHAALTVADKRLLDAQTRINDLERSTSWRITKPLRSTVTHFRRRSTN